MAAVFLADAHLKGEDDPAYGNLMSFLDSIGLEKPAEAGDGPAGEMLRDVTELYILGDLFEFWLSRKGRYFDRYRKVVERLISLKKRGVRLQLCEGNHDFFMSDYFSGVLQIPVCREFMTIRLNGKRVLISHGDTIDRANRSYLLLRRLLRSKAVWHLKERLPENLIWAIAAKSSDLSKGKARGRDFKLVEKMHSFAMEKFYEDFDAVILGHCHTPVLREANIDGKKKTFVTLGDWMEQYSYLLYADGCFNLLSYRPSTN